MANPPYTLAHWFVTEYLGRPWTETDKKGMHLRHAKDLLREYAMEEIKGCLELVKQGKLGDWRPTINALTIIRSGEPPLIEQYRALEYNPPPIYMTAAYAEWRERFPNSPLNSLPEEQQCQSVPSHPPPLRLSGRLRMAGSPRSTSPDSTPDS